MTPLHKNFRKIERQVTENNKTFNARGGSTVVRHSTHNSKIQGSVPAAGTPRQKMANELFCQCCHLVVEE